jgi:hypothetical protein
MFSISVKTYDVLVMQGHTVLIKECFICMPHFKNNCFFIVTFILFTVNTTQVIHIQKKNCSLEFFFLTDAVFMRNVHRFSHYLSHLSAAIRAA